MWGVPGSGFGSIGFVHLIGVAGKGLSWRFAAAATILAIASVSVSPLPSDMLLEDGLPPFLYAMVSIEAVTRPSTTAESADFHVVLQGLP